MKKKITLDKNALKKAIKRKLLNEIAARAQNWKHTNSSGSQSPAQWWVDKPVYQGAKVRHQLATDIETTVSENGLEIRLIYQIEDISPQQASETGDL